MTERPRPHVLRGDELASRAAAEAPGWEVAEPERGTCLRRTSQHGDFATALAFLVEVGALAEERDHHPDVSLSWDTLTLELRSHSAGGVTEADLALAAAIDGLVAG